MTREEMAESLRSSAEHLTDLWTTAVRQDPRIRSDDHLTHAELEDEIRVIIDEIAVALVDDDPPSAATAREGRVHVYTRYRQGYRARDIVRELSLLRLVVLDFLATAATATDVTGTVAEFAEVARVVNLFVDEEMRYAITIYVESPPPDGAAP